MSDTTITYLSQAFSTLRTPEEFGALLRDMCTLGELTSMAERLRVAEQLQRGVSYRDIAQSLGSIMEKEATMLFCRDCTARCKHIISHVLPPFSELGLFFHQQQRNL